MPRNPRPPPAAPQAKPDGPKPLYVRLIPRPLRSAYRRVVPRFIRWVSSSSFFSFPSFSHLFFLSSVFLRERSLRFWLLCAAYVIGQRVFNRQGFGVVWLVFSLIFLIFYNLDYGGRRSGMSAYSVFNPDGERLVGTYDAAEYDRMLRNGGGLM